MSLARCVRGGCRRRARPSRPLQSVHESPSCIAGALKCAAGAAPGLEQRPRGSRPRSARCQAGRGRTSGWRRSPLPQPPPGRGCAGAGAEFTARGAVGLAKRALRSLYGCCGGSLQPRRELDHRVRQRSDACVRGPRTAPLPAGSPSLQRPATLASDESAVFPLTGAVSIGVSRCCSRTRSCSDAACSARAHRAGIATSERS